jgi:hypothetical protein
MLRLQPAYGLPQRRRSLTQGVHSPALVHMQGCVHLVVAHLSGQEHTRPPCNARSSVFIRMKRRIG